MKSHFSRVAALSLLASFSVSIPVRAQPNGAAQGAFAQQDAQTFKMTESNKDALAIIGAFFNKINRAASYHGHLKFIKTILVDGEVTSKRTYETESSWVADLKQHGERTKTAFRIVSSFETNDKTEAETFNYVDDGKKNYLLDEMKKVWVTSNHNSNDDTPPPLEILNIAWTTALRVFGKGGELKIGRTVVDGQERILVNGPDLEYVFDAKSGDLISVVMSYATKKTEIYLSDTQFDLPLPDSFFEWKAPEGTSPGRVIAILDFSF